MTYNKLLSFVLKNSAETQYKKQTKKKINKKNKKKIKK